VLRASGKGQIILSIKFSLKLLIINNLCQLILDNKNMNTSSLDRVSSDDKGVTQPNQTATDKPTTTKFQICEPVWLKILFLFN
jgi:hypothetical protein